LIAQLLPISVHLSTHWVLPWCHPKVRVQLIIDMEGSHDRPFTRFGRFGLPSSPTPYS
jgi:hypothetical protein